MPISADLYQPIAHHASLSARDEQQLLKRGNRFDVGPVELSEIRVGTTNYPLRRPIRGTYYLSLRELQIDGVCPVFIGSGVTADEAISDFCSRVHCALQELIHKRPFEMTADESQQWKQLNNMIDVTRYRNRTPIRIRQFGEVCHQMHSFPKAIRWDNGFTEQIDLRQVNCDDFVTFKSGQPIEAVVERDAVTRKIVSIPYICRVKNVRSTAELQKSGLVNQISTSASLPDAGWD